MKVRILNTNEPVTTFYRDIVPYFVERGDEVEILISRANYRKDRKLDDFLDQYEGVRLKKIFSGFVKSYNTALGKKYFVHFMYAIHATLHMLFGPKADVNVFMTQPPFFNFIAPFLKFFRGTDYFQVVFDLYPHEYIEFGYLEKESFMAKWLHKRMGKTLHTAKGIIVCGRCMGDIIAEEMDVPRSKIHYVANWTTEDIFLPIDKDKNPMRTDMGWQDKFVVAYGGNIGNAQNFDDYLAVAESFEGHKDIYMVLIGGGARFEEIKAYKDKKNLSNLIMLPFQHDNYTLAEIYGASDINFISLRENCTGMGVPGKAYNSLATGQPILYQGSPRGEIARMVTEDEIGKVVTDGKELKEAILHFYENPELLLPMKKRAREMAETKYSTKKAVSSYHKLITA